MSGSQTDGKQWRNNDSRSARLSSHAVDVIDPVTPDTEERCANRTIDSDLVESPDCGPHIPSHHLLSISQSTLSPNPSQNACASPAKDLSTIAQSTSLQIRASRSCKASDPARSESPGVAPHLQARAARCASPSLQASECAPADVHASPSTGLRALMGTLHAAHHNPQNTAALSCNSANKLVTPLDSDAFATDASTCSTHPPVDGAQAAPSESSQTPLKPARLHLDPAEQHARRFSSSTGRLRQNSSPSLLRLSQRDAAAGQHGDALRSNSLGKMKPARARRNTRDLIHRRRASRSDFTAGTLSCASSLHSLPSAASPATPSVDSASPSPGVLDKIACTEGDLEVETLAPAVTDSPAQSQACGTRTACNPLGLSTHSLTAAAESIVEASGSKIGSSVGADKAPVAQDSVTQASAEKVTQTTGPLRPQRLKPKKGAQMVPVKGSPKTPSTESTPRMSAELISGVPSSRLKKSISTAAVSGILLENTVVSALESGLVVDSDVNVYGMRTPWHGLRHDDLHEAAIRGKDILDSPAKLDLTEGGAKGLPLEAATTGLSPLKSQFSSQQAVSSGLKRTNSCPSTLKDPVSVQLVKPEYSRRNHKNFLDLYDLGPVLGTGGYAVVRECTKLATGEKFAAKMMTVSEHPEAGGREIAKQALMNELEMMARLQHPNIVRFLEYFLQDDPSAPHYGACIIVMDLLEGPDMMDYIDEADEFTAEDARVLMQCLMDAVSHMHNHGISHRDLKLENLVLGRKNDLKSITIVDFGLAKAARARERMEGVTGTLWYTAPEILLGKAYSPLVDLWSLGVVMYLALTGDYPFEVPMEDVPEPPSDWEDDLTDSDSDASDSEDDTTSSADNEERMAEKLAAWRVRKREELLEDMICDEEPDWTKPALLADPVATDLVRGLLCKDPKSRLAAAEALEHRWFTGHICQDHATLKHVHRRISALCTADELPMRTFEPGEWIVKQAARACRSTACFLLLSGEAAVLLHAPASSQADSEGFLHLCNRRAGNFVGAVHLHLEDSAGGDTPRTPLTSRAKSIHQVKPTLWQGASSPRSDATPSCALSTSNPLSLTSCAASEETYGCKIGPPAATATGCNLRSSSEVSSATDTVSLAAISTCTLPEGSVMLPQRSTGRTDSVANSEEEAASAPEMAASRASTAERASLHLRVMMTVIRAAKRWIGHRRTVGVRAVTPVVAVTLSHDDMRWAVAHDFRMSNELTVALKARRLTVAKAIKEEKRAAKAAA